MLVDPSDKSETSEARDAGTVDFPTHILNANNRVAMPNTPRYWLHIDEHGRLAGRGHSDTEATRLLAGLLIPEDAVATFDVMLADLLRRHLPHVPPPYHASHVRTPICHAVFAELSVRERTHESCPPIPLAVSMWLKSQVPDEWTHFCDDYAKRRSFQKGSEVLFLQVLSKKNAWLGERLRACASASYVRLLESVRTCAEHCASFGAPAVALAAAGHDERGWSAGHEFRYQDYLYVLALRVVDAMKEASRDGTQTLLVPQSLGLEQATKGWWKLLQPEHVAAALRNAMERANDDQPWSHTLDLHEIRLGANGTGADTAADILAAQLAGCVAPTQQLARIEKVLWQTLRLKLRHAKSPTTISALGPSHQTLEDCRDRTRSGRNVPTTRPSKSWPEAQVTEWAKVLR